MKHKVLVLCSANVHRSPFVAEYIRRSANQNHFEVRDAGFGVSGEITPIELNKAFKVFSKGSIKKHKSKHVNMMDLEWADVIIVMEKGNAGSLDTMISYMKSSDPNRYARITDKVEKLYAYGDKEKVIDPYHYLFGTLDYGKSVCELATLTQKWIDAFLEKQEKKTRVDSSTIFEGK